MTKKNGKNYYDAIIKSFMKSWQRKQRKRLQKTPYQL